MLSTQSQWTTRIFGSLAVAGILAGTGSVTWAQADADQIARNLAPIGEVCLAGDNCTRAGNSPGVASSANTAATSTPPTAPTAAPQQTAPAAAAPATAQPAAAPAADSGFDVAGTYQLRCFACHGTGAAGAPLTANAEQWNERLEKGMDAVIANAINGINAMPARGLCMDCTDDQIRALVDYMIEGPQ